MEQPDFRIPASIQTCQDRFTLFYKNKNTSKKLTWLYANGQVELHMLHTAKKYQLVTNVFQACILCLFNDRHEITCDDIK